MTKVGTTRHLYLSMCHSSNPFFFACAYPKLLPPPPNRHSIPDAACVRHLVAKYGLDPCVRSDSGKTAIMCACTAALSSGDLIRALWKEFGACLACVPCVCALRACLACAPCVCALRACRACLACVLCVRALRAALLS